MTIEKYPYLLSALSKTPIWGGTRLLRAWGKQSTGTTLGESWELSVREKEKSRILNGKYAGKTLESVLAEADPRAGVFPILVKLIDAGSDLSVQVHPDDEYAARVEKDRGKTEMWYIVEADPGAEIVFGLADGVTREDFARAVGEGRIGDVLNRRKVRAGDVFFVPSGLVHAIGKGILIAEIQQNCDLTYRVYDYDRVQPDGTKRELHVQKALDVVRPYSQEEIDALRMETAGNCPDADLLVSCRYFRVLHVSGKRELPTDAFARHLLVLGGEGNVNCGGIAYPLRRGMSYYLPAGMGDASLSGNAELLMTEF